ncbi:MAG: sigma-54 dependent transcriptional regulator [Nitrospinota bacterium]|nr:sigma-54 dependent transcriptional regulator [Nitrospinota bacterium]
MSEINKVLIIDDEEIVGKAYRNELRGKGFDADTLESGSEALNLLNPQWPGIVVSDIIMPEMDGLTLLKKVKEMDPDLPVVLITGQGDIPMAVKAIQQGAYDFLEKPFETSKFIDVVKRAMEKRRLILEVRALRTTLSSQKEAGSKIVGKSPAVERLRTTVKSIADCDVDVLLLGETGTGKDLIARSLHEMSKRGRKHFVAINCGAMPETIIESELFGHEAGAFTGANKRRIGKFEHADGGTIFLDEIESMPLHLQVKLLHVLQDRVVQRVGSNTSVPVDVRVIAATKVDLKQAYEENTFRKDLYYRLNVVQIEIPPLRDRREDIPLLFQHFVLEACGRYRLEPPNPPETLMQNLLAREWEGNIRELRNEAEKFVLGLNLDVPDVSEKPDVASPVSSGQSFPSNGQSFKEKIAQFEKSLIESELKAQKGDLKKIQDSLSIPKQTLYDKIKTFGLNRKNYT